MGLVCNPLKDQEIAWHQQPRIGLTTNSDGRLTLVDRGGIVLSARDQLKLDLIIKVEMGVLDRASAAAALAVDIRTLRRYIKAYRDRGTLFVLHGNRGKAPANKIDETLKLTAQNLVRERYYDFNMLHALEKINQDLDVCIKREVFRSWCHELGIVKRGHKRRKRPRKYRSRTKQIGILVQMDGSHHKWFGGIESCLVAAIDDATSTILGAGFFSGETTDACLEVLKQIVKKYGSFKLLYVDKAGVFGGVKRSGFSHVETAMGEFGTQVIYANSPQAKGRIERLFDTLQDRLIPEMRLAGIKTFRSANKYLQEVYIPQQHNPRFSCRPESPISAFQAIKEGTDLDQIFCKKEYRKVARDHTISFEGHRYMLDRRLEYSLSGQRIEIRIYADGKWLAFYGLERMKLIRVDKIRNIAA